LSKAIFYQMEMSALRLALCEAEVLESPTGMV
jgi:hypothetical protein